ncbi:hypothetical protein Bbelb_292950 [Branchiostoma belcheri]|nr:hypothetical protein Bbelb_292950 [Branchiostoma belcheri]
MPRHGLGQGTVWDTTRTDCNNYRGISLLNIFGKVFARVALARLQVLADLEKCREQQKPLYMAFVDLTKAFDLVTKSGLFRLLEKIGCPPELLNIIRSFHNNMQSTVSFDGSTSELFPILSGVKQGCVLVPTLFARLRAKTKVTRVLLRELLFANDAALASHTPDGLQRLMDSFSDACKEFALKISIKKTEVMVQDAPNSPAIHINGSLLAVTDRFTYLGSTVTNNMSLDVEISTRIGKAASVMSKLNKRVWENRNLTMNTKLKVYQTSVLSTLLYGSETWTTYAKQEAKLNAYHMRCLRRILGIKCQDKVSNTEVLDRLKSRTLFVMISERRLRWLGHVRLLGKGRIPKDLLYGQLESGSRPVRRPRLRYRDVCKRDLDSAGISVDSWKELALNRSDWKHSVKAGVRDANITRSQLRVLRRQRPATFNTITFTCSTCGRVCHSRIGLFSHQRRCQTPPVPSPSSTQTEGGR